MRGRGTIDVRVALRNGKSGLRAAELNPAESVAGDVSGGAWRIDLLCDQLRGVGTRRGAGIAMTCDQQQNDKAVHQHVLRHPDN
jgi:hypothetical protein